MPLPKSLICNSCKHTYPEGWVRCPYCGFDPTREKRDRQIERALVRRFPRYAAAINADGGRRKRPAKNQREGDAGTPRDAQQRQTTGTSTEAARKKRRRRGRRRVTGPGQQQETTNQQPAQASASRDAKAREQKPREQKPREARPQRPKPAPTPTTSAPTGNAPRSAEAGGEARKRRRRRPRRRRKPGEGGDTKPPQPES